MRHTHTPSQESPRNAYAAARNAREPRHHALIDTHNARFAARYAVQMVVLFLAVLLFSIIVAAILGAWHDAARGILTDTPARFR